MTEKGMVDLQNCMDLLKVEPHSYSWTCLVSCHGGNQLIDMKIEVTDMREEGHPLLMAFPVRKPKHSIICIRLCVPCKTHFTNNQDILFLSCLCLSIHMKQLHSCEQISKSSFQNV